MLKSLRSALILAAFFSPLVASHPIPAYSQERQGCYMVNETGRFIDLGEICPSTQPVTTSEAATPTLGTGDIQVTLRWATTDDLDLYVTDPEGQIVYYGNPSIPSGGRLDVDANAGCGESNSSPIENVFWPPSQAPTGNYQIKVELYSRCNPGSAPIPFEVRLLVRGEIQTLTGSASDAQVSTSFPFTLP
jgi:hypothetical protein